MGSKKSPQPRIIDSRNRVALSPEALKALEAQPGDYITWEVRGTSVKARKVEWHVRD